MSDPTPEERARELLQCSEVAEALAAAGTGVEELLGALATAIRLAVDNERRVLIDQFTEAGRENDNQGGDPYAGLAFRDAAMLVHARLQGGEDAV